MTGLLRRRPRAARVPVVQRRARVRRAHRPRARRGHVRPERGEPPALGVRRRTRPGAARADRRAHEAGVGGARARALGHAPHARGVRRRGAGRDRRDQRGAGARRRRGRHRPAAFLRPCRRRSSPRSRTCSSPRPRSVSAPRSRRSPPCSPTSCATRSALPETVVPVAVVPLGVPARAARPASPRPVRRPHPPRPLRHPLDRLTCSSPLCRTVPRT